MQVLQMTPKWQSGMKHIYYIWNSFYYGCGMGPWLVLVSPCFRDNVVATCKIGSFLCSWDNLLHKNLIVFFLEIKFTREKSQKFLQHISHSHTYMYFAHLIDFFCLTNFEKIWIYQVWFLFGMIPGVDSYSRHIGTINK